MKHSFFVRLKQLTFRKLVAKGRYLFEKSIQYIKGLRIDLTSKNIKRINDALYSQSCAMAESLPESGHSGYFSAARTRVAIIIDEFMYNYYKAALELTVVTPENYRKVLNSDPDFFIFVTCWHQMNSSEWSGSSKYALIADIFDYARSRGIKTIFQSIEDPPNYETFLPLAKHADYIFTSAEECIESYRRDTGIDSVYYLGYGVNPLFHNPIGISSHRASFSADTVFFAGSWADRYKERCSDIRMLFDGVLKSGHNIMVADRNQLIRKPGYKYPGKYQAYLVPAIQHSLLQRVHKLFNFSININSVKHSHTMCAMRIYELQALGSAVLTNYSLAISENFPGLFIVNDSTEIREFLDGYSDRELYRIRCDNIRSVMTNFTVYDRLNYIFDVCGYPLRFQERTVLVICKEKTDNIQRMFDRQSYPLKKLIDITQLTSSISADYIAVFDDACNYGRNYLRDMVNAYKYSDPDFVTKSEATPGEEYNYIHETAPLSKSLVKQQLFTQQLFDSGYINGTGFKLDGFELDDHWEAPLSPAEIAVIVPVFNNGKYLYGRCFRSLLRSSIFDKMHIYLIDDGSTDGETIEIINDICDKYGNVSAFFFGDGGSGSASRPRNKGVEISKEPYITYLDPDNEALNDGYAKLWLKLKDSGADFAFGAIFSIRDNLTRLGYLFKNELITETQTLLMRENMRPHSIQACLIKRELITENHLENPVGAIGQDSLFFQELMLHAHSAYYLNEPIHLYYAERSGSAVNAININFFKKSLVLEKAQAQRFEKLGVLDDYIAKRLDYFVINWYLEKLASVSEQDRPQALAFLEEIVQLYGRTLDDYKNHYYTTPNTL